jgi:hypothetical protein
MKFSHYATALASLSLFASTLAAPVHKHVLSKDEKEAEREKQISRAKNKYFHEPGYAIIPLQLHLTNLRASGYLDIILTQEQR